MILVLHGAKANAGDFLIRDRGVAILRELRPGQELVLHPRWERVPEDLFDRADAVALELQPGDVLFHCLSAPHGSRANKGETIRRVFYLHYMAREVLEHCYGDWAGDKLGFTPEGIAFARSLLADRADEPPSDAGVELTDEGFVFSGSPTVGRHHWRQLIDQIDPEELAAKRSLA